MGASGPAFLEALASLEAAARFGINPSLEGIRALTDALSRPQDAYRCVQVTGTNGKTSVTRAIAALLATSGRETGTYTSPHLESYTERVEVDGTPCGEEEFAAAVHAATEAAGATGRGADAFTEFELLTAAALWLFREREVDWACLEVGMGGRWDATSVVDAAVAVVTGVGIDHAERLGSTIEAIAFDKSHVIRSGASAILGPGTLPVAGVFLERARGLGIAPVFVAAEDGASPVPEERTVRLAVTGLPEGPGGRTTFRVRGLHAEYRDLEVAAPAYQAPNLAVAIAAAEGALGRALGQAVVREALERLRFPGRFELVEADPPVVLDGAHNPQAAGVLASAIQHAWTGSASGPVCVLGVLSDKDAAGIVSALAPACAGFVATAPDSARALPAERLAGVLADAGATVLATEPDPSRALALARAHAGGAGVVVTGSLYTVGQVRGRLRSRG